MPSKNPIQRLNDILENIRLIKNYTRGASHDTFNADQKTKDAVERCLERISEAAGKLGNLAQTLSPDQPWSEIRAIGNIIRHEYDNIDPSIVWNIINQDLDPLRNSIEAALEKLRRQAET